MTLIEYLHAHRAAAAAWPGGETTWKMLVGITQGFNVVSMGGAGGEALRNCHALLWRIVDDTKADLICESLHLI